MTPQTLEFLRQLCEQSSVTIPIAKMAEQSALVMQALRELDEALVAQESPTAGD